MPKVITGIMDGGIFELALAGGVNEVGTHGRCSLGRQRARQGFGVPSFVVCRLYELCLGDILLVRTLVWFFLREP